MNCVVQGRQIGPAELELIGQLMGEHPEWSRRRLSWALCEHWDWRNEAGQCKDMASRTLLVKLHERGLIPLPARRQLPSRRMGRTRVPALRWDDRRLACALAALGKLQVQEVSRQPAARAEVAATLRAHHYLGFAGAVGENLQYTVRTETGRPLACVVFGAAAWKCLDRDRFIGWRVDQRRRHLHQVANNCRFLILPWVEVPHLASWVLGAVCRRLSRDWHSKYGHRIDLVETFVQRDRFAGTAYRAANWLWVGQTTGRTRQDRRRLLQVPRKDIYLYPTHRQFRARLCA